MRQLFRKMKECLTCGQDVVLATVTASRGSVPRGAGARMLVGERGRICGTVGGGAVEHLALQRAAEALRNQSSDIEEYRLHENQIRDIGMVCGGNVQIHFQYVSASDKEAAELLEQIRTAYLRKQEAWLVQKVEAGRSGELYLCTGETGKCPDRLWGILSAEGKERPVTCSLDGCTYYCEKLFSKGIVYIFGGGHVAQALVPVLASADFRCIVLEDREEFCRRELFPQAEEVRMICNDRISEYVNIGPQDYVCVMTRGHKDDTMIQAQILRTPACYIGVIGSRRKAETAAEALKRDWGIQEEELRRVHTPIGLDIGAETPAEIAVSIAAELIRHRADRI